jgi:hypothetical protein
LSDWLLTQGDPTEGLVLHSVALTMGSSVLFENV